MSLSDSQDARLFRDIADIKKLLAEILEELKSQTDDREREDFRSRLNPNKGVR